MIRRLPLPMPDLRNRVLVRRVMQHIGHPSVPTRLHLRGIVLSVVVVDPAGAEGQLVFGGLVVVVAVAVAAGVVLWGLGFCVADVLTRMMLASCSSCWTPDRMRSQWRSVVSCNSIPSCLYHRFLHWTARCLELRGCRVEDSGDARTCI